MDTFDAIEKRRSIKHYDPEHQLSEEEIHQLMSLAMLTPTAFNIQNVRFVLVQDRELRKKIRAASWDQSQVTEASLLIILCADVKSWSKEPARYWRNASREVQDHLVPTIDKLYRGDEQIQRDEAMRSCGLAAQTIMLTAKAMGYDTCPMDGFDFEVVGKLIQLPEDHLISMFVVIGKSIKEAYPRPGQLSMDEVVIWNQF